MNNTDNFSAEQLEKFRRKQVMDERERYGWHKFSPYIDGDSQKKRRQKARRVHR